MHLQNLVPTDRPINRLPFIPLGDIPLVMAMPYPVQLGNGLPHALDKSVNRAHAILRVLGATLERRQGDHTVIYDDPNLLGRGEGGIGARQYCLREMEVIVSSYSLGSGPRETHIGIERWSRRGQAVRCGKTSSRGCGHRADDPSWQGWSS